MEVNFIRSVELILNYTAGNARLGEAVDYINKIRFETGYLVPYIAGSEDIEVILKNPEVIPKNIPIEICGIKSAAILNKITTIGEPIVEESGIGYLQLTSRNHLLMSFPPEVVWLGRENGLSHLKKSLERFLPYIGILDRRDASKVANIIISAIKRSRENYEFWKIIATNTYKNTKLSKILFECCILMASKMRCRYMSGFNPLIDIKTPGSVVLNHRVNLAFAALVEDIQDSGLEQAPVFFYTIPINSTMIQPDKWCAELEELVKYCRSALETTTLFGGIHITIRNLDLISKDPGRVRVIFKLFNELNKLGEEYKLPVWYSNFSLIGLAALDEGADFASFTPNMSPGDVIIEPGPMDKDRQYGKVLNIDYKELWDKNQVEKATQMGHNLPKFNRVPMRNQPDSIELESPPLYRRFFSKPYNIAAMTELSLRWRENIKNGEIRPGRQYLQDFSPPYNVWGLW